MTGPRPPARVLLAVVAACLILGGGLIVDRYRQRERSVMSGFFESQPTVVASRTSGRVRRIVAPEGTRVDAGALLLELEAAPGQADLAALNAAARQAHAHYLALRAGPRPAEVAAARARYDEAAAACRRVLATRPQDVDRLRDAEQQARARYDEALHGPTAEERGQAWQQVEAARAHADFTRHEWNRQQDLYRQDATSQQAVDQARSNDLAARATLAAAQDAWRQAHRGTRAEEVDQAREAWRQARVTLEQSQRSCRDDEAAAQADMEAARQQWLLLKEGTRPEDVAAARAQSQQADEQARAARLTTAEREVRSPLNAAVERVLVANGDLVTAGTPLMRLADPTDIWLRVYLPEADLAKVKVGDPAELQIDGIAARVPAVVDVVATQGEFTPANVQTPGDRGRQVYAIRLRLAPPDARVKAGMQATVKRMGQWP